MENKCPFLQKYKDAKECPFLQQCPKKDELIKKCPYLQTLIKSKKD
jgi:hypothetical protein